MSPQKPNGKSEGFGHLLTQVIYHKNLEKNVGTLGAHGVYT